MGRDLVVRTREVECKKLDQVVAIPDLRDAAAEIRNTEGDTKGGFDTIQRFVTSPMREEK